VIAGLDPFGPAGSDVAQKGEKNKEERKGSGDNSMESIPGLPDARRVVALTFVQLCETEPVEVCIDYEPRGPDVIKLRHSWLQLLHLFSLKHLRLTLPRVKVAGVATWPGVVREVAVRWGDSVRPQLPAQTLALGPVNSLAKVGAAGKNVLQAFANIVTTINKSQPNSMQFSGARGGSVSVEVKHFASTLIVELLNAAGYLTEGAAVSVRTVQALLLEDPGSSYAVAVRSQRPGNLQQGLQQGWESVLNSLKTAYDQLPNEGVIPFAKGVASGASQVAVGFATGVSKVIQGTSRSLDPRTSSRTGSTFDSEASWRVRGNSNRSGCETTEERCSLWDD